MSTNINFNHIHFEEVESTQDRLKKDLENYQSQDNTQRLHLYSARRQTNGKGRQARKWTQFTNTLCFSFTVPIRPNPTLTSLEISVHLLEFLKTEFNFSAYVKWPNDIYSKAKKKMAGILIDVISDIMVVGIGINIGSIDHEKTEFQFDTVDSQRELQEIEFKHLPKKFYQFLLSKFPYDDSSVQKKWIDQCIHLNIPIKLKDGGVELEGQFIGIGKHGEAIIKTETDIDGKNLHHIFSGTLLPDFR